MFPPPSRRRDRGCGSPLSRAVALARREKFSRPRPLRRLLLEAFEPRLMLDASSFSAAYFNNADLTSPVLTRSDPTINFAWGKGAPAAGVDPSTFSVRWTGHGKPTYGDTYTFFTTDDDGAPLCVNGHVLILRGADQPR